jgi:hypothetical protein
VVSDDIAAEMLCTWSIHIIQLDRERVENGQLTSLINNNSYDL